MASSTRDNFSKKTSDILAKRAGYLCSNPDCKKSTIGSNTLRDKSTSIGVAAHITAAAKGGPRFDENLGPKERSNIENGIWLCNSCSTMIDRDIERYKISDLIQWKEQAEKASGDNLSGKSNSLGDNKILKDIHYNFLKQRDFESKTFRRSVKPRIYVGGPSYNGSSGEFSIDLNNKGESAIIESIINLSEDVIIHVQHFPKDLDKDSSLKIFGKQSGTKHIQYCYINFEVHYSDLYENTYSSSVTGSITLLAIS